MSFSEFHASICLEINSFQSNRNPHQVLVKRKKKFKVEGNKRLKLWALELVASRVEKKLYKIKNRMTYKGTKTGPYRPILLFQEPLTTL